MIVFNKLYRLFIAYTVKILEMVKWQKRCTYTTQTLTNSTSKAIVNMPAKDYLTLFPFAAKMKPSPTMAVP